MSFERPRQRVPTFTMRASGLVALLVLSIILSRATSWAAATNIASRTNGLATLYFSTPPTDKRDVSADLTLPFVKRNAAWYCDWIMIVSSTPESGFVQVGLIRRPHVYGTLHAFIAYELPGHALVYKDLFNMGNEKHSFSLRQRGQDFWFFIDGRRMQRSVQIRLKDPYVQIGSEVSREGDALSGTIRHIVIRAGVTMIGNLNMNAVCTSVAHGLTMNPVGDSFVADGVFDSLAPSNYRGDCAGIGADSTR